MTAFDTETLTAIRHYLQQIGHLIDKVAASAEGDRLWQVRLAPDMLDTGCNLAVASGFAARALCRPAGIAWPDIPDTFTCDSLRAHHAEIRSLVAPIEIADLRGPVKHIAGEADLEQDLADYILRFALPNMIFHLSMAYAGLRHSGLDIGKADFDGLHIYTPKPR